MEAHPRAWMGGLTEARRMAAGTAGLLMEGQGEDHRAKIKMAAKMGEGAMTLAPTVPTGARRQAKGRPAAPQLPRGSKNRNRCRPPQLLSKTASLPPPRPH